MWVQTVQGMFVTQDVYRGSMYLTILPLQCSNVNTIFTKLLIINNIQKNFAPASANNTAIYNVYCWQCFGNLI